MCQPFHFHSGLTSKTILAYCFCYVAAGPENAQTEKCDVGQITAFVPLKKWNSYGKNINSWLPPNPSFCVCCPHISLFVHSRAEWTLGNVE